MADIDLMVESRASPLSMASPVARLWVFAAALLVGVFDLGSYWFLKRASIDFVVAGRTAEAPAYRIGSTVAWTEGSPGALFGWGSPEAAGTWSVGRAAALALRLPSRPAEDLVLTAAVIAFVDQRKLPVRHVEVLVNGTPAAEWRFEHDQPVERAVPIAAARIASDGLVRVDFRFREVRSPAELGTGADTRRLSILLLKWRVDPAGRPQALLP